MSSVYIHWPFCQRICPYCDYAVHRPQGAPEDWLVSYLTEISTYQQRLGLRKIETVFFGGGTPSLMPTAMIAAILEQINRHWPLCHDCEISLEANPTEITAHRLRDFRHAGITRLSVGVQAFDDHSLRGLGRAHTAQQAQACFAAARAMFPSSSLDLMYGRPQQTVTLWQQELATALALEPQHLSLYQLTVEDGTPFARRAARGTLALPDSETIRAMEETAAAMTAVNGISHYEISSHATAGNQCRHNLNYWHYGEYIGIGPAAHGRIILDGQRHATHADTTPRTWAQTVANHGHGAVWAALDTPAMVQEMILLGLRLQEGICRADSQQILGTDIVTLLDAEALKDLCTDGLINVTPDRLTTTAQGFALLNTVLMRLM